MHSHVDIGRVAGLADRRAQRARVQARQALDAAWQLERDAAQLRQESADGLEQAQLGESHGINRQRLFDLLRGLAVARAHVLECALRADQLGEQARQERATAQACSEQAAFQQSRARRLQAVQERFRHTQRQAQLRRHEQDIQEEYACR